MKLIAKISIDIRLIGCNSINRLHCRATNYRIAFSTSTRREKVFDFDENRQRQKCRKGESSKSQLRSDALNVWELWTAYTSREVRKGETVVKFQTITIDLGTPVLVKSSESRIYVRACTSRLVDLSRISVHKLYCRRETQQRAEIAES